MTREYPIDSKFWEPRLLVGVGGTSMVLSNISSQRRDAQAHRFPASGLTRAFPAVSCLLVVVEAYSLISSSATGNCWGYHNFASVGRLGINECLAVVFCTNSGPKIRCPPQKCMAHHLRYRRTVILLDPVSRSKP